MWPDDLALFQYYKGIGIGVLVGVGFAWLTWRLPVHLRTRMTRKYRKMIMDTRRIQAMYTERNWTPNARELRVVRVPLRDRIVEWWQVWLADWRAVQPRTPEQVAEEAYQRALVGMT